MKTFIQDIREMTDSREMLEARPNSFIIWFIYILLGIIAAALAWAYFGEIEDYVKANGTVRPAEAVSSIRNLVAGRVDKNYFEEGKSVKKGDVLYTIEIDGALLEKNEYESQVKRLELENRNLLKFKQSINEEKNLFDRNNKDEIDYYNRYRKYETDRLVNAEQYANQGLDIEKMRKDAKLSLGTSQVNLEKANKTLTQQKLLEKSINEGKNLFGEKEVEYYNRYDDYKMNIEKLEIAKQQSSDNYEKTKKLYDAGGAALKELEDAKNRMELAALDLEGYKNEYMMNLKSSIIESQRAIDEITISINKAQSIIEIIGDKEHDRDVILEKMRLDTLVQIDDLLTANQNNLDRAKSMLKRIELNIREATVISPIDGRINLYTEISSGDYLQSGAEIAAIVPETETEYKVQLMVSNEDIAEIKPGQRIKYHFLALPYNEYGEAEGTVRKISADARIDNQSGISYYIVEATLENHELKSYKGVVKEIKVGMVCEAQVVTGSRRVLRWLLEKIDIFD